MPGSPQATPWRRACDASRGRGRRRLRRHGGDPGFGRRRRQDHHRSISATITCSSLLLQLKWAPRRWRLPEIAWPIRHLVRKRKEVTTLLGEVTGVDTGNRSISLEDGGVIPYDTLVLATGASARLLRPRRVGTLRTGPQDIGRRHLDPPAHIAVLRTRRTRDRPGAPRRAADLRDRRRRADRSGTGRRDRRACAAESAPGISAHRHAPSSSGADRGGAAHFAELYRGPLCLRARLARAPGSRNSTRPGGARMQRRRRDLRRPAAGSQGHSMGGRGSGILCRGLGRAAGR